MRLFYKALLVLMLGSSFNEAYTSQGPQVASAVSFEAWWNSLVDPLNPLRWPFQYGLAATSVTTDLLKAAKDALVKKEFTPKLSSSLFKTLGFAAMTISPWIVYRIWFKNFYNAQMLIYATIREIVKKHYETHAMKLMTCGTCFNQSKIMYATEKAWVMGHAQQLRRVATLYTAQDSHLIKLLKSFYANLEAGNPCYNQFVAIQNHCMGILP